MKQYEVGHTEKNIKREFKFWTRADTKNGFVSEFQVCVSKKKEAESGLEGRVLKNLTGTILGKNNHVYCDNSFTRCSPLQEENLCL